MPTAPAPTAPAPTAPAPVPVLTARVPSTVAPVWQVLVSCILAALAVLTAGPVVETLPLLYLAAVTPPLCVWDVTHHRLPNHLVAPAYGVLAIALTMQAVQSPAIVLVAILSGVSYFGLLLVLSAAGGMGMGDVKLAGVLGLSAGMFGLAPSLLSPILAFLAGGVAAIIALVSARGRLGTRIPFGPFMLAGFWAAILFRM